MRKTLVTGLAVGTLVLSGLALGGTALADESSPSSAGTATSRIDRIKQALSGLVSDKTLTQAQADKVAETLAAQGAGPGAGPGGKDHRGGPGRMGGDLGAAAKALGMTESDLRTALRDGKSLATLAKEKNVAVDKLVDALTTAAEERLQEAVKDGRITQAQADEMLKNVRQRITDRVNAAAPLGGRDGRMRDGHRGASPSGSSNTPAA